MAIKKMLKNISILNIKYFHTDKNKKPGEKFTFFPMYMQDFQIKARTILALNKRPIVRPIFSFRKISSLRKNLLLTSL